MWFDGVLSCVNAVASSSRRLSAAVIAAAVVAAVSWRVATRDKKTPVVKELWVFPIKGVKGMSVSSWPLGPHGLLYDRDWAVVYRRRSDHQESAWSVASCNKFQKLAAATANVLRIDAIRTVLQVAAPTMAPLILDVCAEADTQPTTYSVDLFGMRGLAEEFGGPEAQEWWQNYLGTDTYDVRFCRIAAGAPRKPADSAAHNGCPAAGDDTIAFHDYAALHIICADGVRWLQAAMPRATAPRLSTAQFRANVVVDGVEFPDEDTWSVVALGDVELRIAKQSGRCVIPTHNDTGARHPTFEPTATLRRLRSAYHRHQEDRDEKTLMHMFGVDALVDKTFVGKCIRVGDAVSVVQRRAPPTYFPQAE